MRIWLIFLILLSCSSKSVLKIGIIKPAFNYLPLKIAEEKGFLKNLKYEFAQFNSGWELGEALIAQKVDVAIIPFTYCLQAQDRGIKVKIIACLEHEDDGIIVRKGIETITDLKGKKIGTLKASTLEFLLRRFLMEKNITETKIIYFSSPMEMWAALEKKEVDTLSYYVPGIIKADNKIGKIIHWYSDDWKMHPCCDIAVQEEVIKKKRVLIKDFLEAIGKGVEVIKNDTSYAVACAEKNYGLSREVALESLRRTPFRLSLTDEEKNFETEIGKEMYKIGYLKRPINSLEIYYSDFLSDKR